MNITIVIAATSETRKTYVCSAAEQLGDGKPKRDVEGLLEVCGVV
jgi:hypothetical protein